jgi:hypothetical protein
VLSDFLLSAEVEAMAQKIAGTANPDLLNLARRIAEAEVDILRVRRIRARSREQVAISCRWDTMTIIYRYERRALSRRKFAIRASMRRVPTMKTQRGLNERPSPWEKAKSMENDQVVSFWSNRPRRFWRAGSYRRRDRRLDVQHLARHVRA